MRFWSHEIDVPFADNMDALGDSGGHVLKYSIPCAQRGRILERLRLMNITREQLFPGLDGFAQSFQQFLFRETETERRTRESEAALQVQRTESVRVSETQVSQMAADDQNRRNAVRDVPTDGDNEGSSKGSA